MVYFSMDGCPDCIEADKVLEKESLLDLFSVHRIYREKDPSEERKIDTFSLYKQIYGIDWYPTFLHLSDNGYALIGKTPTDQLEKSLLELGD